MCQKRFLNIFNISLLVIPDFTNIYWWEGNTNVNLIIHYIVMVFVKNWNIYTMFRNYILVDTKNKVNTRHGAIYGMNGFIYYLCISSWWCERVKFYTRWVSDIISPQTWIASIKITCDNWTDWKFIIYVVKTYINYDSGMENDKYRLKNIFHFVNDFPSLSRGIRV